MSNKTSDKSKDKKTKVDRNDGSVSDDGDWRPTGASAKKLVKQLSNVNQTKRNLFNISNSRIGSDGNTSGSSRSSSFEEPTKTEKGFKQNIVLSRAARAQTRKKKKKEGQCRF